MTLCDRRQPGKFLLARGQCASVHTMDTYAEAAQASRVWWVLNGGGVGEKERESKGEQVGQRGLATAGEYFLLPCKGRCRSGGVHQAAMFLPLSSISELFEGWTLFSQIGNPLPPAALVRNGMCHQRNKGATGEFGMNAAQPEIAPVQKQYRGLFCNVVPCYFCH